MQTSKIFFIYLFLCVFSPKWDLSFVSRGIQLCEDQRIQIPWKAANEN